MAITKISSGKSSTGLLTYIKDIKPKHDNDHRVLAADTINTSLSRCKQDFKQSRLDLNGDKNDIENYHLITSFDLDEIDPNNIFNIDRAMKYNRELMLSLFGDNSQIVSIGQADGKGGNFHIHNAINNIDLSTGKALRGECRTWYYISKESDKLLEKHNILNKNKDIDKLKKDKMKYFDDDYIYKSTFKDKYEEGTERERIEHNTANSYKYSFVNDLQNIINTIYEKYELEEEEDYFQALSEYGVSVRKTGKEDKTKYSYHFSDEQNKQRKIRENKLTGEDNIEYGTMRLKQEIQNNKESESDTYGIKTEIRHANEFQTNHTDRTDGELNTSSKQGELEHRENGERNNKIIERASKITERIKDHEQTIQRDERKRNEQSIRGIEQAVDSIRTKRSYSNGDRGEGIEF